MKQTKRMRAEAWTRWHREKERPSSFHNNFFPLSLSRVVVFSSSVSSCTVFRFYFHFHFCALRCAALLCVCCECMHTIFYTERCIRRNYFIYVRAINTNGRESSEAHGYICTKLNLIINVKESGKQIRDWMCKQEDEQTLFPSLAIGFSWNTRALYASVSVVCVQRSETEEEKLLKLNDIESMMKFDGGKKWATKRD